MHEFMGSDEEDGRGGGGGRYGRGSGPGPRFGEMDEEDDGWEDEGMRLGEWDF